LREQLAQNNLEINNKSAEIADVLKQARQEHALQKIAIQEADDINLNIIKNHNKNAFDYRNDTLINYDVIERGPTKNQLEAEIKQSDEYLDTTADEEIKSMRDQGIITEEEFDDYQNAVSTIPDKMTSKAMDVIKTCFTRG
jgi:hypothetical protein